MSAEVITPVLIKVAERLAAEGIPILAIARAIAYPSAVVRSVLIDAMACGTILDIPREDWPPNTERNRTPFPPGVKFDERELVINCTRLFKVTRLQASILSVLLRHKECSKDTLHNVVEQCRHTRLNKSDALEATDPKIVDVVVCHLRKKLKPFDLKIDTNWGNGYCMSADMRKKAAAIIAEYAKSQEVGADAVAGPK